MRFLYIILLLLPLNLVAIDFYELTILEHRFIPDKLYIPKGQKVKLVIINKDNSVEEFESLDLRREKIIPAQGQITLNVGPLEPGEYEFFGEFNHKTAQGKIIVE